jgi:predicted anti-sigma-YlaC factor YlaD
LYVDKNLLAIDMQEKLTASELQRTKAEASAASFKVEALLWKQRSTTLEENLSHTTARLQEMEQVLMAHDKVVSEHQRWIQKKQTIESENIASILSSTLKIIKLVFVVLVLVAMMGVDPYRLPWIEYFSETYSGM